MPPHFTSLETADTTEPFDGITVYAKAERTDYSKQKFLAWICVGGIHVFALLIAAGLAFIAVKEKEIDYPPRISNPLPDHKIVKPPVDHPPVIPQPTDQVVETENLVETPVVVSEAVDDTTSSEDVASETDGQKGKTDAVTVSEMGDVGTFAMIGAGGPPAGMFGNRTVGHKITCKIYYGPIGRPVDTTINAGLEWLKKHQSADGSWSAANYFKNCQEQPKCEPGKDQAGDTDSALTGYALMCFLGSGYDHKNPSKYRKVCTGAVSWLVAKQSHDGRFGKRNYEHAIATQAIVEAYAMTGDNNLNLPVQNGLKVITEQQAKNEKYEAFGWDYEKPNVSRNDTSVMGWNIMALKSALGAGINTASQLKGAEHCMELAWKAANPHWKELDQYKTSTFPYCWNAITNVAEKDTFSAVSAACLVFMGRNKGDVQFETLLTDAEQRWLSHEQFTTNLYHTYYLGMAEFEAGDAKWTSFRDKVIPWLISSQRKGNDCSTGSFDATGQNWPGADTGRVLSTCYSLLTLEVAYRYAKIKR